MITSLDLIELSGGSLEQPKVVGVTVRDDGEDTLPSGTIKREAYFIEFAASVRLVSNIPIMMTGGFRTVAFMDDCIRNREVDVIGLARPFAANPEVANKILDGQITEALSPEKDLQSLYVILWNAVQIDRLASSLEPNLSMTEEEALTTFIALEHDGFNRRADLSEQKTFNRLS